MDDAHWMRRALELARHGRGLVEPNPMVGAVVVRGDTLVGEGWHRAFGGPHAEVHALDAAGTAARGATLYVTLEPCSHFGKTPPCTDAIVRAGIVRVVAATGDPFPQVDGGGFSRLRAASIAVEQGLLESDARRLNASYFTLLQRGRPQVHAKWAMTLDGHIATRTGNSKWISGEASRHRVHELRAVMDAVMVGAGTLRADDPRLLPTVAAKRTATRIVVTRTGMLPQDCELLRTARASPVLIAHHPQADCEALSVFQEAGCELLCVNDVASLLTELGGRRLTNVMVEGGSGLLGSLADAGLIDEVHVFIAPRMIGGADAFSPVAGTGAATIAEGCTFVDGETELLGPDIYWHGYVHRASA
jgi:diaminohydroxyphosphoribosylaminopyrimidine deaminase/5-amino-6-(5-phosphoribosylamino)uracil reductase